METLKIDGELFEFVKTRVYNPISVYKGRDKFLRIGPEEHIKGELEKHRQLLKYGFPIAKILKEGKHEGKYFYTEESLGNKPLGDTFWEECKQKGKIQAKSFKLFIDLSQKLEKAQLSTASKSTKFEKEFYFGVHIDYMIEELPHFKSEITSAFEKVKKEVSDLPYVITHGDFNAYNFLPRGIIDIENNFHGPAGYDLIGNIYSTYFFPKAGDYESKRRYEFTKEQIKKYFDLMDKDYVEAGLPKLSDYKDEFVFIRGIWAAVRMQRTPNLQKWRYKLLEKIMFKYLDGKPIVETVREFSD